MAKIQYRNLRKVFPGGTVAVDDVNLEVADGEFVVFVGPSGSGKTTVLRMTAGLEEISGGEIAIDGEVVNRLHPMDRDIAMVFQSYALYPHMTVAENIAYPLGLRHVEKAERTRAVREVAELLEIRSRYQSALRFGVRRCVGKSTWTIPKRLA